MQKPSMAIWKHVNTTHESSDLLEAKQIARKATWKHMKFRTGVYYRPIEGHANTTQRHLKTHEILSRNLQNYWKPCKYHAEPLKTIRYSSGIVKTCGSRADTTHSHPCEYTWHTAQESSDLLEAVQKPRTATWKYLKCRSGIVRLIGSHVNTTQSHKNVRNTAQESWDLLEDMQILCRAAWKYIKYRSGIFRLVGNHANTTYSHLKTCEIQLRRLQIHWKPCKYHAEPYENT